MSSGTQVLLSRGVAVMRWYHADDRDDTYELVPEDDASYGDVVEFESVDDLVAFARVVIDRFGSPS